jgi:hypothetical protein
MGFDEPLAERIRQQRGKREGLTEKKMFGPERYGRRRMRKRAAAYCVAALVALCAHACGGERAPAREDSAAGVPEPTSTEPTPSRAAIDACAAVAQVASRLPGTEVSQITDSFPAFTGPAPRHGCVVSVEGPTSASAPVPVVATTLPDSLGAGWTRDSAIVANGPSETVYGIWQSDVLCLVRVRRNATRYAATIGCEQLRDRVVPRG